MGLEVGIVTIEYLEPPGHPIRSFLQDLMQDQYLENQLEAFDDESDWGHAWEDNALYEFDRDILLRYANGWAGKKRLNATDRAMLTRWIDELPYRDNAIMLHFGR